MAIQHTIAAGTRNNLFMKSSLGEVMIDRITEKIIIALNVVSVF
jgi:hypothetical protein